MHCGKKGKRDGETSQIRKKRKKKKQEKRKANLENSHDTHQLCQYHCTVIQATGNGFLWQPSQLFLGGSSTCKKKKTKQNKKNLLLNMFVNTSLMLYTHRSETLQTRLNIFAPYLYNLFLGTLPFPQNNLKMRLFDLG